MIIIILMMIMQQLITHRRERSPRDGLASRLHAFAPAAREHMVNLPTKILDFRGFDSNILLILRGGILTSIGNFPESLSQAILAGMILVGRLGVSRHIHTYACVYLSLSLYIYHMLSI